MTLPFNYKDGNLDIACDDILKLINIHQDFLFLNSNLPLLAYILCRWESLYNNARIVYSKHRNPDVLEQCSSLPKDELLNGHVIIYKDINNYKILKSALEVITSQNFYYSALDNKVKTNKYFEDLSKPIYDEWDILYWKKNKSMKEWIYFLSNIKHKNYALFQHEKNILNHLFFSKNSFKWNKEGYLDSKIKISLFGDFIYSRDLLPPFIKEPLYEILYRPECVYTNEKAWSIIDDITNEEIKNILKSCDNNFDSNLSNKQKYEIYLNDIQEMVLNRGKSQIIEKYNISHFSIFFSTPKNVDNSYIDYIVDITYDILKNKELYDSDEINLIERFIKNNPHWFRKRTIAKLLK